MDSEDKTLSWLVIITFLALVGAIMFATFEMLELKSDTLFTSTSSIF